MRCEHSEGISNRNRPANRLLPLAIPFLGLLAYSEAEASQIHLQDVDLAVVVKRANLIVVAKPLKPFKTVKPLVLRAAKHKKKATFQSSRYHFSIVRVLKNTTNKAIRRRDGIEVTRADEAISRSMARAYRDGVPVPSPILSHYKTKVKLLEAGKQQQQLILFLSWYPPAKNPRFVVVSGYDQLGTLGKVKRHLRKQRRKPRKQ